MHPRAGVDLRRRKRKPAQKEFGRDTEAIRKGLEGLWQKNTQEGEAKEVFDLIVNARI